MAHIGHHPAPGLGELIPGSFVVPSNPIITPSYIPHIGELLPASFPVPQNPLIAAISSPPGYGIPNSMKGLGCGCSTGCGSGMCGDQGMAGLSGDCGCIGGMCGCGSVGGMGLFEDPMSWIGIALVGLMGLWMLMPGGQQYHSERERLAKTYQRGVRRLKGESRGYRRVARKVTGALASGAQAVHTAVK
jgi:hypothetical protein